MKKIVCLPLFLGLLAGGLLAQAPLSLKLSYTGNEFPIRMKALIEGFSAREPSIKIEALLLEDPSAGIEPLLSGGEGPDIVEVDPYGQIGELAGKGLLVDLSGSPALARLYPAALPGVSFDGRPWALPMDLSGIGIIYNKGIFAQNGLNPPATYAELQQVCSALKAKGITPFAALLRSDWSIGHFFTLVHTALLAEKGIDPLAFAAAMDAGRASYGDAGADRLFSVMDFYAANLSAQKGAMDWDEQVTEFAQGRAAMMVQGLWSYEGAMDKNPNLDCGFIPFPISDEASHNRFFADVDTCYAVSAAAMPEKRAAALRFLEWLSTPEAIDIWVKNSSTASSFQGADLSYLGTPYEEFVESVAQKGAFPWAFGAYSASVWTACRGGARLYVLGKESAAEVIRGIDEAWKGSRPR